jgi:anthranilate phosphoribosyltransferase
VPSIAEGLARAQAAIDSGAARARLDALAAYTHQLAGA